MRNETRFTGNAELEACYDAAYATTDKSTLTAHEDAALFLIDEGRAPCGERIVIEHCVCCEAEHVYEGPACDCPEHR
jgi:hypothetical protein